MHDGKNAMQQRRKVWKLSVLKAFPIEKARSQKNPLSGQICLALIEKRKAFVRDSPILMKKKKKTTVG